ncbi:CesT family type III secretion system chaperone [Herbaspirillum sp. LeCh32-8]|uniref:CesT family type III secretion system chaperone n=1 Tax=Herbaspirillum sp. LeCh32-8 TaxID=2821356 RepID=UPI001AE98044|nr:CesT family type III secretion system chaperone [Herbaspirillum sp. LeCh32-8]MBP0597334.1 CesT family type III secretion system chaperone [Herbaspirillum sp. LeCh32-8]
MSIQRYWALVTELYRALDIDAVPGMHQATRLRVDEVDFILFYDGLPAPGSIVMHCVFGELPTVLRERILLRLLETQSHLFGVCTPVFSCNAGRQDITLMCRYPLQHEALAEATLELLHFFAGMARRWREDHFLDADTP